MPIQPLEHAGAEGLGNVVLGDAGLVGEGLGVVAKLDRPEDYAAAINGVLLLPDRAAALRDNLRRAAPSYTWSAQAAKLVEAYGRLDARPHRQVEQPRHVHGD